MCDYFGCNVKGGKAKLFCDGKPIMRYCEKHGLRNKLWLSFGDNLTKARKLDSHFRKHYSEELI